MMSPRDHGRAVLRTSSVHTANERRGDSSRGSLPGSTGLCGLPAQRTSRTRSPRSQSRYSPPGRDNSTASTPVAVDASDANSRTSRATDALANTPASAGCVATHSTSERRSAVDGTSPAVSSSSSYASTAPVALTMRNRSRALSIKAFCQPPRVDVASMSWPSIRRMSAVVRTCVKFSSTAMRVATISAMRSHAARTAYGIRFGL